MVLYVCLCASLCELQNLSQEFLEAMRNFKKNAEKIRRHNAQEHDPRKVILLHPR